MIISDESNAKRDRWRFPRAEGPDVPSTAFYPCWPEPITQCGIRHMAEPGKP